MGATSMKIAIVGSRRYPRLDQVNQYMRLLPKGTIVVSGGAIGVDRFAARAARDLHLGLHEILPDWEGLGKRAGMLRNADIVSAADLVVAFWDGESRGTKNTIDQVIASGKPFVVVFP